MKQGKEKQGRNRQLRGVANGGDELVDSPKSKKVGKRSIDLFGISRLPIWRLIPVAGICPAGAAEGIPSLLKGLDPLASLDSLTHQRPLERVCRSLLLPYSRESHACPLQARKASATDPPCSESAPIQTQYANREPVAPETSAKCIVHSFSAYVRRSSCAGYPELTLTCARLQTNSIASVAQTIADNAAGEKNELIVKV